MDDILDDIRSGNENDEIKDWKIYLGEEANYYIPKWDKIQSGQIISFNIYAFIFGIFWMLYRKMYRTALIVGGFIILQLAAEELLMTKMYMTEEEFKPISWISTLAINTLLALFSNWLFYKEAKRKIADVKNTTIGDYDLRLLDVGGTSVLSIFIGLIIYVVAIALALVIIDPTIFNE